MKLSEASTNVSLEDDGVWVTMTGGWEAKVRSTSNINFRRMQQKQMAAHRKTFARGQALDPALEDQLALKRIVETILIDWRGLEDENGTPIECTKENAYKILGDRQYRHMLDDISDAASTAETFRAVELEEDLGN